MRLSNLTIIFCIPIAAAILAGAPAEALAKDPINTTFSGVAVKGYDPVAYFTAEKPVKGKKKYEYRWQGAQWRFSSAEHLALFKAAPEKYAPQYGGYWAYAVALGTTADIDPVNGWQIVDEKLYLNYSRKIQKKWQKDIPGHIEKANRNWPGVLD